MGIMIVAAAYNEGPMAGAGKNAPDWLIALGGYLFIGCGLLLLKLGQLITHFIAGATVLAFTAVFAWVSLFGEAEHFSPGPSWLSDETNLLTARILFGLAALLGAAIFIYAMRYFWQQRNKS